MSMCLEETAFLAIEQQLVMVPVEKAHLAKEFDVLSAHPHHRFDLFLLQAKHFDWHIAFQDVKEKIIMEC